MAQELPGDEAERCHICLEASPLPIQSGCACRGAAGLAHVDCRIQVATVLRVNKGLQVWWECQTCLQPFTGGMSAGLADAWWSEVGGMCRGGCREAVVCRGYDGGISL